MHPDDRERIQALRDEVWTSGRPLPRRSTGCSVRDGEEVWLRDSSVLVLSDEGQRLAWQGVIEDITSERRAEQEIRASEARYRALVERVPAVVYEMGPDDERQTLFVSPHVEEVLGYTRAEWLDQPDIWIELLHADDREVVLGTPRPPQRDGRAVGPRVPLDRERRAGRLGPRPRELDPRSRAAASAAWHGVMIDITAEHDATEMLLLHKEDLERRVAERTNELREANELMALEIGERRRMEAELRTARGAVPPARRGPPRDRVRLGRASRRRAPGPSRYVSPRIQDVLGFSPEEWQRVRPRPPA